MAESKTEHVTIRAKLGPNEFEVTGPSDFVERKISEFLQRHQSLQSEEPEQSSASASSFTQRTDKKQQSISQFFRKISPKTDVDRILAAGFFLEKMKSADKFTSTEAKETVREAKIRPPKNPSDAIAQNIKKGLMMAAGDKEGKMAFVLTTDGEEYIANLLEK